MAHRGRGHLHDAYDESANHITELQLQNTELSASSSKAKGPNEKFSAEPHAIEQQKHELGNAGPLFSIRKMGRSFANTVRSHVPAVMRTTSQAKLTAEDRDLAHGLKGNAKQPNVKHSNKSWGSRQLSKLRNLFVSGTNERDLSSVESERTDSSTSAPGSSVNLTSTTTHCVACGNDNNVEDIGRVPCGHVYCRDCLQNLVKTAIADEAFFPPRCCRQTIPFGIIQTLLTSDLVLTYINKHVEFKTPNRTYCYVQTCSTFIGSGNIVDNVGTCRECRSKTCTICKAAAHDRGECPKDPALQEILKMMGENGWQRCKSCSSVIELKHGCNHITCRCGAHFCYLCGLSWRTCTCAQWDERRLLDHANLVVDRRPGAHELPLEVRSGLVARLMRRILDHDECNHPRWRHTLSPGFCEHCGNEGLVLVCRGCHAWLCRRCINNWW